MENPQQSQPQDQSPAQPELEESRIKKISEGIHVNERTSSIAIESTGHIAESVYPVLAKSIEKTGIHKLTELCCGDTQNNIGRSSGESGDRRLL